MSYLEYADTRTNVNEQIRKDLLSFNRTKLVLNIGMFLIQERFVCDILQQEVAALDQTFHLIFFVNTAD